MDEIAKILRKNRPNITDSSIVTYVSLIINLLKKMNEDIDVLNKPDKVIDFIKQNSKSSQTAKTLLSAIIIFTNNDKYRDIMEEYINDVNQKYREKRTDEKRLKSGITSEKITQIYEKIKKDVKMNPTYENWNNYIICLCVTGIYIAPRRSMDWTEMKIRNYDKSVDNYYDKKSFYFNKFKTAKTAKSETERRIILPLEFTKILNKWMKINSSDYLVFQKNGAKFTSSSFNKKLNSIFGVSVDMLRSLHATDKFGDSKFIEKVEEMQKEAKQMGTSLDSLAKYYIKNDLE
jgi:integrase